jgi:peptidoglycan/xylan/chitin deacetylase (PgdA/CDA1 family)
MESCKNHPEKLGKFRCYYCKEFICLDCRLHLDYHYFCGNKCYLKYNIHKYYIFLKPHRLKILAISQFLLFLVVFYLILSIDHKHESKYQPQNKVSYKDSILLKTLHNYLKDFDNHWRETQSSKKIVKNYQYNLDIAVEKNWVVNIWQNNLPIVTQGYKTAKTISYSIPLEYGKNHINILVLNEHQNPIFRNQLSIEYKNIQIELLRRSIERGNIRNKVLALTFDAGSNAAYSNQILSILRKHNLKCTLFLTGDFIKNNPDIVRQMVNDGHEIGNHTFSHPHLTTYKDNYIHQTLKNITRSYIHEQLNKTDSIFYSVTGQHLQPYWRAPYGEYNAQILTWAAEAGYLHIRWTNSYDTFDWVTDGSSHLFRTPEETYHHIMKNEKENIHGLNGVIVLMHLNSNRDDNHVFKALPKLIQNIRGRGYSIGPVSQIIN